LEAPESEGSHAIIGGKTILGKIFAYQEKTGASYEEVLALPYVQFVIGMADAPHVDYNSEKPKKKSTFGTPKSKIPEGLKIKKP